MLYAVKGKRHGKETSDAVGSKRIKIFGVANFNMERLGGWLARGRPKR